MNRTLLQMPKGIVWLFLLFLGASSLTAQSRRVTGKVSDVDGPFPGATVVVKGTTNGTVTDVNGDFAISVPGDDAVLVVSATSYESQEIPVGTQTAINVTLKDNVSALTELVVTGYTVDTKRQSTGAVSTVKSRDLTAVPTGNVEQQLQGRVAGLTVITNGQPGTSSIVRVRGFGAFGGNEPLYVVDGVPVGNTDFLAPDDIETTTVLKDAASASIYGARAANGVIVYTTKHGKKTPQKLSVTYDALYGVTTPGEGQTMLNPQEQADWSFIARKNAGEVPSTSISQYGTGDQPVLPDYINVGGASGVVGPINLEAERAKYNVNPELGPIYQVVKANKSGTDWYGAITRNAPVTRHTLGFMGSTEASRYYLSLSLQDQAGVLIHNDFKRHTMRVNTEFDVTKRLRIGENLQFTFRQVNGFSGGGNGAGITQDENDILSAFRMAPIIPVYDEFGGYAGTAAKDFNNARNPVAARDGSSNNGGYGAGGFGNFYLELDILEGLMFRSSIGGNYGSSFFHFYSRRQYENSENQGSFIYGEGGNNFFAYTFTNTANYKKAFGNSSIDLLAGIEALNTGRSRQFNGSGQNPFSLDPDYISLDNVSSKVLTSSQFKGVNFYSMFGQVKYGFMDRYYLTGVLRRDGSSRFGENSRYGVFPAISAAWRVSGEGFMDGVSFVDDLKIRGGWGQMGNSNNVDPNNQYSLFQSSVGNAGYDIGGTNNGSAEGFHNSRVGNPDAKWETSTTTNIGIDALLLRGKLDIILDLWDKKTDELLFQVPLANVLGSFASAPSVNIATMSNQGIDLQIVNKGNFSANTKYELTLTGSWLKNEITGLAPGIDYFEVRPPTLRLSSTPTRNQIGYSIASFYGYQVIGLFQNAAEVASAPTQDGAAPGRFRFADVNGKDADGKVITGPDGKIDDADRTYLGSPVPKFLGGVNLKVTFGMFDIETYMYTSLGNKIFNLSKWYTDFYPSFPGAAVSARVKDSWTPSNTGAELPIFENISNLSTNSEANSYYIEDGSYFRMQNLAIGFNLNSRMLSSLRLKKARVYVATNNVFTISKYDGLDPAVGGAVDTNFGIDIGNYPVTRSFMVGVNIGL